MWRKQKTEEPQRRPTDEALLEALRLNDDHVRGLTRLDQELVYVPLTALAAGLFAVLTAAKPPLLSDNTSAIGLGIALAFVPGIVQWGLRRNQRRHEQLLGYRDTLVEKLELPVLPERPDLGQGRLIYFVLFVIGWGLEALLLLTLLTTPR
ncbi:MAG: hypothetical protein M3O99_02120 [Chloroflexota bacterium]|nr:hypothetical protein [Chloroflexota bacterium]